MPPKKIKFTDVSYNDVILDNITFIIPPWKSFYI